MIDPLETYERTKDVLKSGLEEYLQLDGGARQMRVSNIRFDDKADQNDIQSQADAKNHGATWGAKVIGDVQLIDKKTGKQMSTASGVTLMRLPKPTQRFTYIVDGNEVAVRNQLRLRSGVYTVPSKGGLIKTHVNTWRGKNFYIVYDPAKDKWVLSYEKATQNPMYEVLQIMGVGDDQIAKELGDDTLQRLKANRRAGIPQQLYKNFYPYAPLEPGADPVPLVRAGFEKGMGLNSETTAVTLGKSFEAPNGEMMLAAMKKQLAVARGQAQYDERDSMIFKQLQLLDDHLKNRMQMHLAPNKIRGVEWRRWMKNRIDRARDARTAAHGLGIDKVMKGFFETESDSEGGLTDAGGINNPVAQLDAYTTTTIGGPGGTTGEQISDKARALHTSTLGLMDPIHTPESSMVGAIGHLAVGARRAPGSDTAVAAQYIDTKTGEKKLLTSTQASQVIIGFPEDWDLTRARPRPLRRLVAAIKDSKLQEIPHQDVHYVFPDKRMTFDFTLNMVPWLDSVSGARGVMAGKMMGQSISLVDREREAPLVQVESEPGRSWEQEVARMHLPKAPTAGVVTKVTSDAVFIREGRKTHRVGLYNFFPVGTKASGQMHNSIPTVKVGDSVRPGQIIADSNFTKDHTLALGKNLTVAYIPYKGLNFEDGLVVSESAAKKMTSQHLHRYMLPLDPELTVNTNAWRTHFPTDWKPSYAPLFSDNGVIKVGAKVEPGMPLILAMRRRQTTNVSETARELHRLLSHMYTNAAVVYDQDNVGVVKAVIQLKNSIEVQVFAEHPTRVGDKFAGRYGNKGVVSAVIPDAEMPRDASGKTIDLLMNPIGVPGRINPAQVLETAAAKVGKPLVIRNFSPTSNRDMIEKYLAKHGVSDTETITDPTTGRQIPNVLVGKQYILKLEHEAEKKLLTRDIGGYNLDRLPSQNSRSNPQTIDHLTMYGMLAHGARANIREMVTYKGSDNPEFWRAIALREPVPPPQSKWAWTKFNAMLKQLGVNVKREGDNLRLQPLTDNEVIEMAAGEIKDISFLRAQDLKPEKGGLFDPVVTGGLKGSKWSYFKLHEPLPNPTFEDSIKSLLEVTKDKYEGLIRGDLGVKDGRIVPGEQAQHLRGAAFSELLKGINVEQAAAEIYSDLKKTKRPEDRSKLYRKLRVLLNLRDLNVPPDKAFMVSVVPVMPPIFRPVYPLPTGPTRTAPVNYLYRDAFALSQQLEKLKSAGVPQTDPDAKDAFGQMYQALSAIQGYADPISRNENYRGIMAQIRGQTAQGGGSPKEGWFQSTFASHPQDASGRGVLVNGPDLHIDQVGLPESMAWDMFRQFTLAELKNLGMTPAAAVLEVKKKSPIAKQALERAMRQRPVWVNRAPTLHRHGILAFEPILVPGNHIKMHPFVYKGFNADVDGDTLAVHVPATPEAVDEARHYFPSQHPFAVNGELLTAPSNESQWGLWKMTQAGKKTTYSFKSLEEANAAYQKRQIGFTDVVTIGGHQTTLGRSLVNHVLPPDMRDPNIILNKNKTKDVIVSVAKKDPKALAPFLDALKDMGYQAAYEMGSSITLKDIKPFSEQMKPIIEEAKRESVSKGVVKGYGDAIPKIHKMMEEQDPSNNLVQMLRSGAAKKTYAIQQILGAPMLYTDSMNKPVESPVTSSFSDGLSPAKYWASLYGARMGVIGRSKSTEKPGGLAKNLIHSTMDNVIVKADCGTTRGVMVRTDGLDAIGRFSVQAIAGHSINEPIPQRLIESLREKGIKEIKVRSPLSCLVGQGTCAKCWGLDESGHLPKVGTNVGIISAHNITEPSVQLSMNAFHCSHEDSVVFARSPEGTELAITMADLFEMIDLPVQFIGDEEIKGAPGWQIWDGKWVSLQYVRRHPPGAPMTLISDRGVVTICQDNHPIEVVDEGFLSPAEIEPGMKITRDLAPVLTAPQADHPPFPGYVIGMYIAEGNVTWKRSHAKQAEKRPYAVVFSQKCGPIKDRLIEELDSVGQFPERKITERMITLNSVELGQRFHDLFGRYSSKKALPPNFLGYHKEWLADFLSGVIDGDGTLQRHRDGPTMLALDTTSFELAQQILLIGAKLGLVVAISATTHRPLTRQLGFRVRIRCTAECQAILKKSAKAQKVKWLSPSQLVDFGSQRTVGVIRKVFYPREFVYDCTTETGTLVVSGIRHHNTGGIYGATTAKVDLFRQITDLLNLPKNMPNKATLAKVDGKVTSVKPSSKGGFDVIVNAVDHYVPPGRTIRDGVAPGAQVSVGDALSDGIKDPRELATLVNFPAAQEYLAGALQGTFAAGGTKMPRKHFETVVRSASGNVSIVEDPTGHYLPGQIVNFAAIDAKNQARAAPTPVKKAAGTVMGEKIKGFERLYSRVLTLDDTKRLAAAGVRQVKATHNPIMFEPRFDGIEQVPQKRENWLAQLAYRGLDKAIRQGAAQGWESNLHGIHPIPALVFGKEIKFKQPDLDRAGGVD